LLKRKVKMMKNKNKITQVFTGFTAAVLLLGVSILLSGCLAADLPGITSSAATNESGGNAVQNTISVTGEGSIKVLPDEGFIDIAVTVEKLTTQEAVDENSKISLKVTQAIETTNAENLKIQTTSYDLSPMYDYSQENQPPKIYAYRTTTVIEARTTDLKKIGEIIAKSTEAGASSISSIGFDLTKETKSLSKNSALAEATKDAQGKAKAIADSMGLTIDKVLYISEGSTAFQGPIMASAETKMAADQVMAPVIFPQEMEITSSVNVVYYFSKQ
jgi:uncharacterized protein YggE